MPRIDPDHKTSSARVIVALVLLAAVGVAIAGGIYAIYREVPMNDWCKFCSKIDCVDFAGENWCDRYYH